MAKGSNSAHSNTRRPRKSNKVTRAAETEPKVTTPRETHRHSQKLVET
ncbi:MAG: hypothetical protein RLZZ484_2088 [Pseudomonadota bacterium]